MSFSLSLPTFTLDDVEDVVLPTTISKVHDAAPSSSMLSPHDKDAVYSSLFSPLCWYTNTRPQFISDPPSSCS